ncbi:MAG: hypothetical protein ABIR81_11395 [Ginsengibacter sp.]
MKTNLPNRNLNNVKELSILAVFYLNLWSAKLPRQSKDIITTTFRGLNL